MRTSLRNREHWTTRAMSGVAAIALAAITMGVLVVVPAVLESSGMEVMMPHVDEAAPRMSAARSD